MSVPARKRAVAFPAEPVPKACSPPELGHSRPVRHGCWVTQWWGSSLVVSISIPAALCPCGAGGSADLHHPCPARRPGWSSKGSDCCSGGVALWHWHVLSQPGADPNWLSPTCTGNGNCCDRKTVLQEEPTRPCRPRKVSVGGAQLCAGLGWAPGLGLLTFQAELMATLPQPKGRGNPVCPSRRGSRGTVRDVGPCGSLCGLWFGWAACKERLWRWEGAAGPWSPSRLL